MTRACQESFHRDEVVQELMAKTQTQTGLKVFVHVMEKVYRTGRKVAADFKENIRIVFDEFLSPWNYRAILLLKQRECLFNHDS